MTYKKKIAWIDCASGIAGNMILGALIDLGFPASRLKQLVSLLKLGRVKIQIRRETRNGISGMMVRIFPQQPQPERKLKEIEKLIRTSKLPEPVKEKSQKAFQLLAQAEARIHSVSPEEVHFHELGAVDTILDIVGAFLGFYELGIDRIYFSPLRLGAGTVKCEHGILPVPAPATLELLQKVPVSGGEPEEGELTTPTGAVLAKVLATSFGPMPEMKIDKIGYGLGERELSHKPNLLRVITGTGWAGSEKLFQLEASIDDMNPEYYEVLMEKIFEAQALEVLLIPAYSKKNRPGILLRVLCSETALEKIIHAVFTHSTTTGLRFFPVERVKLSREILPLKTSYATIRVKKIELPQGKIRIHPEFEDLRKISEKYQIPLTVLEQEVVKQWSKSQKGKRK